MPLSRSAKKKLRQDKKREALNLKVKRALKEGIKKYRSHPTPKLLSQVFRGLDLAMKKNVIHANKVSRIKSRFSKLLAVPKKRSTKK